MDKRVKILVACHKPSPIPQNDMLMPIHVGSKCSQFVLDMQRDDEGENISEKNYCYCELTALYWAWKNLKDVDVIGLCHYRRYFDFHKQCIRLLPDTPFPVLSIEELDFTVDEKTVNDVLKGEIVVPRALTWNCTLEQHYCMGHISDDYKLLKEFFSNSPRGHYKKAFDEIMVKGYKFRPYNMMVMRWSDFDLYCRWLFGLLFEIEQKTDISHYSVYQQRIYGFMAERLLNVWLRAERKVLLERPVIFLDENCKQRFPHQYAPRKTMRLLRGQLQNAMVNRFYKMTLNEQ